MYMALASFCDAQEPPNLVGDYSATSGPISVKLYMVAGPNGSLACTVDSPQQNLKGLPCADVHQTGAGLSFTVPTVNGSWMGFMGSDGNTLSGMWSQGQPFPLNFTRGAGGTGNVAPPQPVSASPGILPTSPTASTATGAVPITAIMFDDVARSVAVPRPEGITVTFIGEDTKITGFHGAAFILRHQKGTSKRFIEGTLLSNTRSGGSLSGGGVEFLREGGGLIYDSGMGTAGNMQESKQLLIAKQLSQVAVDAVGDVRKMPGHESFTPPGYSSLQEISKYRLRSDGSR
jgi:hypothetical protein